jgi:Flp pilus assembly pilin Flp
MPGLRVSPRSSWRRLAAERRSAAAIEFALIAPLMVLLAGGVYDLCQAVLIYNEVTTAATMIVASASNAAVNLDGSTALSYDEVQQAESGIWADLPELREGLQPGTAVKSVTITSIAFEPPSSCPSGSSCNPYTAYVMWSVSYTGASTGASFANNIRTCSPTGGNSDGLGGEKQVPPGGALNAANFTYTLPSANLSSYSPDPTGPAPILVADVVFAYAPVLGVIKTSFTFLSTAIWPVRSVKAVQPVHNGAYTTQPLAQQFTKIYGVVSGATFTPYAAPASTSVASTTPESDAVAGTYCINAYQNSPYPYTTSST